MKRVFVVVPAKNEWRIKELCDEILVPFDSNFLIQMVVVVNNSTDEYVSSAMRLSGRPRVSVINLGQISPKTLGWVYLNGMQRALNLGADVVIEFDAGGSFEVSDIRRLLLKLKDNDAVFSTRFAFGGKVANHSLSRMILSLGGTILSNLVLGLGHFRSDMTSGLAVYRAEILRKIFSIIPITEFLSTEEYPGHFFQTEMRAYVCWRTHKIVDVPIVMGAKKERKPRNLGMKVALNALIALYHLRLRRTKMAKF